eukprot:TRINITY_DN33698_c0_g1_i1.p1 TRINITY_DN33698_c0_g1~~TRINITY_DN33698_c0_g1_i1.p1  ORF type:complete len:520 (+),score=68.21 TRINITY_DN33698_c0_g1_i1:75-1562(+)
MKLLYIIVLVAVKLLTSYCYRSTDFEVHRNWLAVTSKRNITDWYKDAGSQWTLDYPPNFAYFEYCLSRIADLIDPEMTKLENHNYASEATIIFQRCTVIAGDVVLFLAAHLALSPFVSPKTIWGAVTLIVFHPGFIIVDSIHFQYNNFLYGIMFLSFWFVSKRQYVFAGMAFTTLLCFKHIYLYMAPAYFIFLLKRYVFGNTARHPFLNLCVLATAVLSVVFMSFFPFLTQLDVVFKRLFPWGRGLCHAYWAPNFYSLYNVADIVLQKTLRITSDSPSCVNTKGLVDTYVEGQDTHAVLPAITPKISIQITGVALTIVCIKYWSKKTPARKDPSNLGEVIELAWLCALCSAAFFTFSWHVHEKAILMISVPLMFLVYMVPRHLVFTITSVAIAGTLSLYPLLFQTAELPLKVSLVFLMCVGYPLVLPPGSFRSFPALDTLLLCATLLAALYQSLHPILPWGASLPFLPLLVLSFTAALSILTSFLRLAWYFLIRY